jgi:hypothetical protein
VTEASVDDARDIGGLETELKRLEAEYNMYFAGRLPRPPSETRARVAALVKRLDRRYMSNYGDRFRFGTLQARYTALLDLWDRGLRAKEEGRTGPFVQPAKQAVKPRGVGDHVVAETTFTDPLQEMDKLQDLYSSLAEARREAGQEAVPFHKFATLIRSQVETFKKTGRNEVAFRVAVKQGQVALTARAVRGVDESKR